LECLFHKECFLITAGRFRAPGLACKLELVRRGHSTFLAKQRADFAPRKGSTRTTISVDRSPDMFEESQAYKGKAQRD
jgi:hypothetical protein